MKQIFSKLIFVFMVFFKLASTEISPCPKHFLFEPDKSEDDRWYGLITLTTSTNIKGVSLELHFDKPVIQFGNWFGKVVANSENTIFRITNTSQILKVQEPQKVEIFVVYDPSYDIPFPQVKKILLNGREICPKEQIDQNNNLPTAITVNINFPNCGTTVAKSVPLIVHGKNTKDGDWPWHSAVYKINGKTTTYICGGTLISNKHILTAAHCTTISNSVNPVDPKSISVVLGKYEMKFDSKHEQKRDVSRIVVHSDFSRTNYHNDISIIITINPFEITNFVRPICLWDEDSDASTVINKTGTVVGWGRDHNNNPTSNMLMEAQIPVVDRLQCILANPTFYGQFTNSNTICGGYRNGTSVCNGDSGGALVFEKDETSSANTVWQIRGIVSNTIAKNGICDPNYYVIFTDVAKYLDWIRRNMKQ